MQTHKTERLWFGYSPFCSNNQPTHGSFCCQNQASEWVDWCPRRETVVLSDSQQESPPSVQFLAIPHKLKKGNETGLASEISRLEVGCWK